MIKNKLIWTSIVATVFLACNELDVPPINIVGDREAFTSESGITAYMARLYRDLPIEDFMTNAGGMRSNPEGSVQDYTDETMNPNPRRGNLSGTDFNYWNYAPVRNMNYFLQEFPAYADAFPASTVDAWLGEIYFLRAYHYYAMVKRYGGIPIVKEVLNYTGQSVDELKRPRDREADCIDFILSDLDEAIRLLPVSSLAAGRANRHIAYGMKARVALYAASVAKYGAVQLNGLLGIPAELARGYFQTAFDAAAATAAGGYELYNKGGDPAANYSNIFLDQSSTENMFVKYFKYPDYAHHFELFMIPWQIRGAQNYSSRGNPTVDFIERFDDIDGNPFILETGTDDAPVLYADRMDLFAKAEPRLKGIVIFPGDEYKGVVIDVRKGIVEAGRAITDMTSTDSFNDEYNGMTYQGASGMGYNETTSTGFYMRKWLNPAIPRSEVSLDRTETPWIEMRYAEMLLIRAEAGMELQSFGDASKVDDAVACMKAIRERAGARREYTASDLTVDLVRKERRMELFFENKIFWDLKRWRTFDREFSNREMKVLWPIYVWDEQKYYMKKTVFTEFRYTFQPILYYQKVPEAEIQKNTLLVQNPGY
ncbi:MAG: RagB/SusD family nutrient uptake outer membrane protein [Tannerella sp.]|jgi:hypothetical protein|nr:RagB/SusD family nutrient uptake outer membrane protein [Tannerella sp.]